MEDMKANFNVMVFGCICLLTFLAFVFINPKNNNQKHNVPEAKVIDSVELKKSLDELSQKLEKIRELMRKQEEREKESK